jgi:hypothetical protein
VKSVSSEKAFHDSPYFSLKHSNYFQIYDELLTKYVGHSITFLEIGVLDGGSLFMWREFFGEGARIIGIDMNPEAEKWRQNGFEIFIGDQADPNFWKKLYSEIGPIDVLLDDGGHRNDQQFVTMNLSITNIRDGGVAIIEDTQTSYMKFENFEKFNFVNLLCGKIKSLYSRSGDLKIDRSLYSDCVHSIQFFESICALHIDRSKCKQNLRVENDGIKSFAQDFRYENDGIFQHSLRTLYDFISIDYLTPSRSAKNPQLANLMGNFFLRRAIRLAIIPPRGIIYFLLKVANTIRLLKIIRQLKLMDYRK